MSKRDAASFFDLLKAPEEIHRWFCCPPLRAAELAQALRVPISDLNAFFLEPDGEKLSAKPLLYPASSSWPMDYSWSSAIAQDVTLGILRESGLPEDLVLCDSADLPEDLAEVAVVATDDTLLFHRDRETALRRLASFDSAMERARIVRALEKDVNCADRLVGLGCELTARPPQP